MASPASKIVPYQEYLEMPETEGREEVVEGEIVKRPPAKFDRAYVVQNLHMMLVFQLDPNLIWVVTTVFGLIIRKEPLTCREPDLAIFIRKDMLEEDGYIHSAPELVVEVLSPRNTRKDMVRKTEDYERIGVPELWILSPEGRTCEVLQ